MLKPHKTNEFIHLAGESWWITLNSPAREIFRPVMVKSRVKSQTHPNAIGSPAALERPRPSAFWGDHRKSWIDRPKHLGNIRKSWIDMDYLRKSWIDQPKEVEEANVSDPRLQSRTGAWHKKRGTNMALHEPQKMASLPTEKLVGDTYTQPARRVASNFESFCS